MKRGTGKLAGLVLTRKEGQSVTIGDATVLIQETRPGRVVVRIHAPDGVRIVRTELLATGTDSRKRSPRESGTLQRAQGDG